jgi:cytidyltransferase-like protein
MRVLADGCFDPLHYGHVRYLKAAGQHAHSHCGSLVVRVAPDEAIRAKGREPFQTREERGYVVLSLTPVDRVVFHETLVEAILDLRPRYLAKGFDWIGKLPEDVLAACREVGCDTLYANTQERTSSDRLQRFSRICTTMPFKVDPAEWEPKDLKS